MTTSQLARICHEANRAYRLSLAEDPGPHWENAPREMLESSIAGVNYRLDNPTATAEDQHNSWLEGKRAAGWTFGAVKSETLRTHPQLLPYDQLPDEQRTKDRLFQAIVDAMAPIVRR